MTKDQITRLAKEAGIYHGFDSEGHWDGLLDFQLIERRPLSKESIMYGENRMFEILERFAALVATHEREKVSQLIMAQGYATGHGDTIEEMLKELDWQVRERVGKQFARSEEHTSEPPVTRSSRMPSSA